MSGDNPSLPVQPSTTTSAEVAADQHANRAVVFPEEHPIREEKITASTRPKGVEIRRTLTQEQKELAAAGYADLEHPKEEKDQDDSKVDIHEHRLPFDALVDEFKTSFDVQDPAHSLGLTTDESKARLQRDGPNVLTPPKKKSAFRKV